MGSVISPTESREQAECLGKKEVRVSTSPEFVFLSRGDMKRFIIAVVVFLDYTTDGADCSPF